MKNLKHLLGTLLILVLVLTSCTKNNDDADIDFKNPPTAEDFNALQQEALESLTQTFQFNAEDGSVSLTSENGVTINIYAPCLTLNGTPATGLIDLEFIELFDKGNMLITNKPTMGINGNGDKSLLISGGEFYVNATQNGIDLESPCGFQLNIPSNLTGGVDNDMILWNGNIDEGGDLEWEAANRDGEPQGETGVFVDGSDYYAIVQDFGWSNVDRFYNDPRPKTTIFASVPDGYDNLNSAIYLSYDGEDTGLAMLDTYDPETGLFSEHYGQIPIGLECHAIFISEENGNWKYAIKSVIIAENDVIIFTEGDTAVVTEAQLKSAINDLP